MNKFLSLFLSNLPIMQVIMPFILAPICALLPKNGRNWLFAMITIYLTGICSLILFYQVSTHGVLTYAVGGWKAPIGIEYRIDLFNATMLLLVSVISMLLMLYSKTIIEDEIAKDKQSLFYGILLIAITGYLGIIITNDIFNLYVFFEIASLASYSLVAIGNNKLSSYSAFQYLIFGTIAATFILLGIGMLYMITGTLNISDLASKIPSHIHNPTVKLGCSLFIIGCLLKAAIFPMHLWLAPVYQNAPTVISVFLSAIASKTIIYILIRFLLFVIDYKQVFGYPIFNYFMLLIAIGAICFGGISAIFQTNFKRLLAFSSISQFGYIIFCLAISTKESLICAIVIVINHAITKAALFMIAGNFQYGANTVDLSKLHGIAKKMPLSSAALVINSLALVGLPFTSGFINKWQLISSTLNSNYWLLSIVVIGTILSFIYVIKLFENIYFSQNDESHHLLRLPSISMNLAISILTIVNIILGINTVFNYQLATKIINLLG